MKMRITVGFMLLSIVMYGCAPSVSDQITTGLNHPSSPCKDGTFLHLKTKDIESLTLKELELLKIKEQACAEHQSNMIAAAHIAKGAAYAGEVTLSIYLTAVIASLVLLVIQQNK
ncbi:MAG: hypothetical protein HY962_14900 [Ignavibacteriae bacterium]|nr:hypothetical protein [Ignavibacteriota bacterium]